MKQTIDIKMVVTHDRKERQPITQPISHLGIRLGICKPEDYYFRFAKFH
jgi:hypothetical protein